MRASAGPLHIQADKLCNAVTQRCVLRRMLCVPRRRPFLIRGLENTLSKLMLSLEFFDEVGRKKLGMGKDTGDQRTGRVGLFGQEEAPCRLGWRMGLGR